IEEPDPAGGAHTIVDLRPDAIVVRGFRRQKSVEWPRAGKTGETPAGRRSG
ncbi:MAG: hypothetical protein JNL62_28105, partial [Bryobacterales bacterium]|nr:hypothetical protein [Bryobacterales bacterium]